MKNDTLFIGSTRFSGSVYQLGGNCLLVQRSDFLIPDATVQRAANSKAAFSASMANTAPRMAGQR